MRALIFLTLMFFLSCAGSVADPKSDSGSTDSGVQNPVLDTAATSPAADAGHAAASVVMPTADVKITAPPAATGAEPADVDGKPAPVDPVNPSSASAPSGVPIAVPIVPSH